MDNKTKFIEKFLNDFLIPKVGYKIFNALDEVTNREKVTGAIIESFDELNIDITEYEIDQMINNLINYNIIQKIDNTLSESSEMSGQNSESEITVITAVITPGNTPTGSMSSGSYSQAYLDLLPHEDTGLNETPPNDKQDTDNNSDDTNETVDITEKNEKDDKSLKYVEGIWYSKLIPSKTDSIENEYWFVTAEDNVISATEQVAYEKNYKSATMDMISDIHE